MLYKCFVFPGMETITQRRLLDNHGTQLFKPCSDTIFKSTINGSNMCPVNPRVSNPQPQNLESAVPVITTAVSRAKKSQI